MKFETKVIHGGTQGDPVTGAVTTPIYQTSTYHQKELGGGAKYEYTRGENPTRFALESVMADIENGTDGFAFSSGMAAIHATMSLLKAGDHIVMANDVYGGTFRLVNRIMAELGIKFTAVDTADSDALKAAMTPETKMVYLESPSNPLMHVTDIAEASKIAHEGGAIAVVDNTFASPYNQNPLDLGADVVVHSGTKYLGGHADLLSGFVVVKDAKLAERIKFIQMSIGAVLSPQDSYMVQRSIKTLALRVQRHNENAMALAEFLNNHPKVAKVYFPGLPGTPDHEIAKKQMRGFGGMMSIELQPGLDVKKFVENLDVFLLAESLGGVESLIEVPAVMTHASIPREIRIANGIKDELVRISVGIEDIDDLIADMSKGLDAL
ncbi:PLP-dependent aspartate aminotransferase family protein [Weissella confusa]|uniref:PLP-dependent aspartate aminotransferase family protein n=1 Tax=Weissella fermenti TaxID=2987699 RepID=A0ABT6D253_9LACO|nr:MULTISPECIES: PLP-dependent aspartate aminotransferase family protein [Weissella]KRN24584.1 cystathionine beta-lyase [Weissella confusa]MBJ7686541.1 PLP-dependent transferase [Weissella confusa]MBJ7687796.1 PLP-dependent transferase [Weissella confusa]MBJ7696735.1 PLP-dependent transferase [Weissella confusa]MBJ7697911.1 PLP-dependent transferase [Weissella confusa]